MIVDTEGTIISGDSFSDGIATKLNTVKENSRNKRSVASWGSCMGSCLKSKGVESWVISAVTTLCSLGCFPYSWCRMYRLYCRSCCYERESSLNLCSFMCW